MLVVRDESSSVFIVSISAGRFNLALGYRDGKISQTLPGPLVSLKFALQGTQPSTKECDAWSVWLLAWFSVTQQEGIVQSGLNFPKRERSVFPLKKWACYHRGSQNGLNYSRIIPFPPSLCDCNKFSKTMLSLKGRVAFIVYNTSHLTVYDLAVKLVCIFSGTKILHPQMVGNPFTFPIAITLKGNINLLGEQGRATSLQLSPYHFFCLAFFGIQPL